VTKIPPLEWILFWIFIHSCSIWFFTIFLAGLESTGFAINYLIYIAIMGLGITTVAKIVRTKTRHKPFRINREYFGWVCISAFSFWLSQVVLTNLLNIQDGLSYYLLMGCGIYLLSFVFSFILSINVSPLRIPIKFVHNKSIKYGKNVKLEIQVFKYVNTEREKHNISPLNWDDSLYYDAQRRAKEIVSDFSHNNVPHMCGENIAKIPIGRVSGLGFISRRNIAHAFMKTWMNSSGHRENILRSGYNSICIGIATHGNYYYGVQIFR